jgi:hypothetical protein
MEKVGKLSMFSCMNCIFLNRKIPFYPLGCYNIY